MAHAEEHIAALLKLPAPERAQAARRLIVSLDAAEEEDPEIERAKIEELTRRAQSVVDGRATLIDGAEARARVEARLRSLR